MLLTNSSSTASRILDAASDLISRLILSYLASPFNPSLSQDVMEDLSQAVRTIQKE